MGQRERRKEERGVGGEGKKKPLGKKRVNWIASTKSYMVMVENSLTVAVYYMSYT